jgi:putative redox protein
MTGVASSIGSRAHTATPTIEVTAGTGHSFDIDVRGHRLVADQAHEHAVDERGPQPIELFVAGLAACVATYAAGYLERHSLDRSSLSVAASFSIGGRPARVTEVSIVLTVPPELPRERYAPLLAVAERCTAHNTLQTPPHVALHIDDGTGWPA